MRKPKPKPEFRTFGGAANQLEIVGVKSDRVRDVYHYLLRKPWWVTIAAIGTIFLCVNAGFAWLYWMVGGVANARAGSLEDAFYFSVQTLGTIGYGAMYPQTRAANIVVTLESLVGVVVLALSTGIAFAKFARADARIVFSRDAVICPVNGVPHLMFRTANQRGHLVTSARVTLALVREENSAEGVQLYRLLDLAPVRNHHIAFTRSWTIMHRIDERSPLYGKTPEALVGEEAEIIVGLEGLDAASGQTVSAQHSFLAYEILFGMQHADIWTNLPGGRARLDFTRFHLTQPSLPTPGFPYSNGVRVSV